MDYLIPTLLGLAGALAPVALEYWRLERRAARQTAIAGETRRRRRSELAPGEAVVRGGRVYLYS